MSSVVGASAVKSVFQRFEEALARRLADAVETAARQMQEDLVAMAPVKEGDLKAALADEGAVRITGAGTPEVRAEVGFLTAEQKRRAFHAFFVEFGTKGYVKGQRRFAGKIKGKARMNRIHRNIPPRPAHPFFRPAYMNLKRNLERLRAEAHARALVDALAGRTISDGLLK